LKPTAIAPRWTLRQQLTILTILFLSLGGAALWLVAELFESRSSAVMARNQHELANADARLLTLPGLKMRGFYIHRQNLLNQGCPK